MPICVRKSQELQYISLVFKMAGGVYVAKWIYTVVVEPRAHWTET